MSKDKALLNGVAIPSVGFGTWQITDRQTFGGIISDAFGVGFRLFDLAAAYQNEILMGRVIREGVIPREKIFLSDKVWNNSRGYDAIQDACRSSLKKLKTDYLDLYLIHWPASMKLYESWAEINANTWRGMERLYRDGVVRAIGVCNFKVHHLVELAKTAEILPMIDQIEFHPGINNDELARYCMDHSILLEASSPLGNGHILPLLSDEFRDICEIHDKSIAQVCIRYAMQGGYIPLVKSSHRDRMLENVDVFNFELNDEEMERIKAVSWCGGIGIDPDEVTEFG